MEVITVQIFDRKNQQEGGLAKVSTVQALLASRVQATAATENGCAVKCRVSRVAVVIRDMTESTHQTLACRATTTIWHLRKSGEDRVIRSEAVPRDSGAAGSLDRTGA